MDFAKARQNEVFKQLTADTAGSDHENARLDCCQPSIYLVQSAIRAHLLDLGVK